MMRRRRGAGQVIVMRQGGGFLGTLIKICVALVLIMVLALVFFNCLGGGSVVKKIDKTLPTPDEAPYEVFTAAGIYYAKEAQLLENGDLLMRGWYSRMGGKWVLRDAEAIFPYNAIGEMAVKARR